eukprot:COSAG01_NODE_389_length_17708_cov_111.404452_8_plen_139_part_00
MDRFQDGKGRPTQLEVELHPRGHVSAPSTDAAAPTACQETDLAAPQQSCCCLPTQRESTHAGRSHLAIQLWAHHMIPAPPHRITGPNGCLIEAQWMGNGGHGASLWQPCERRLAGVEGAMDASSAWVGCLWCGDAHQT